mgnify:CR=1 FL=1
MVLEAIGNTRARRARVDRGPLKGQPCISLTAQVRAAFTVFPSIEPFLERLNEDNPRPVILIVPVIRPSRQGSQAEQGVV